MDRNATRTQRLRAAGLLLLGALAVHWLRYLIAYGSQAGAELDHQGHSYLVELVPSLTSLSIALVAASAALRLRQLARSGSSASFTGGALTYGLALLAIYSGQEVAEGLLASGHASGLGALLAGGGWVALPLALLVGALISLLERLVLRAEDQIWALVSRRPQRDPDARPDAPTRPAAMLLPARATLGLAFGFSPRPPPRLLSA